MEKTTNNKSIIDTAAVGIEVSWSFGKGDADAVRLPRGDVRALFGANGFTDYVGPKSEIEALKHAADIARPGRGCIIRQLARPRKDTPIAFGICVVNAVTGESGDDVDCGARVRFDGGKAVCLPPEGKAAERGCMIIGERMADLANDLFSFVLNKDISDALLQVGYELNWIGRRRNKGGVYFLLARAGAPEAQRSERFVNLVHALRDLSERTPSTEKFNPEIIEVYPRPLANEMIAGSAKASFDHEVERLSKELDRMLVDGKMREGTMEKRADECDAILSRAEQYRSWLQESTDELAGKLSAIRDKFRAAFEAAVAGTSSSIKAIDEIKSEQSDTAPLPKQQGRKIASNEWNDKQFDLSFFDIDTK
jgi:hypothetical protein